MPLDREMRDPVGLRSEMPPVHQILRLPLRAALLLAACVAAAAFPGGGRAAAAQEAGVREDRSRAADQAYVIGPLDQLDIRVFDQDNLSGRYRVGTDGSIAFPLIGRVDAGGRTARALEELLRERLSEGFLRDPRVNVTVTVYRSRRVLILGQVRKPGVFPLAVPMTVTELLALAEGTTDHASADAVVLRRGALPGETAHPPEGNGAEAVRVDLEALGRGDRSQNLTLGPGDAVFVPRAAVVYVFGGVRCPGRYEMRRDTTVLQALTLARGTTAFAALDRIRIVRAVDGEPVEIRAGLNDAVQPDDVVWVSGSPRGSSDTCPG